MRFSFGIGGKRARVIGALDRTGILDRMLALRARLGFGGVAVLTYHRVATSAEGLDEGVVDAGPDELRTQLEVIKAHGTPITLGELERILGGRRPPPNAVLVTFDDAYRETLDVALPILEDAGVAATFFVPTSYPDGGRLFWWDRIAVIVDRCRLDEIRLDTPLSLTIRPLEDRDGAKAALLAAVKRAPALELDAFFEHLERRTGVTLGADEERELASRAILGWSGIRHLLCAGMDVESHSHRHRVLNGMTPAEVQEDLARSASLFQEHLGRRPRAVAYPVGFALGGARREAVRAAGFTIGFTSGSGRCDPANVDPLNVPRFAVEPARGEAVPLRCKGLLAFGDGSNALSVAWRPHASGSGGTPTSHGTYDQSAPRVRG